MALGGIGPMLPVGEAPAGENDGQIGIGVGIGVAHAATEEDLGVIEEGAITVLRVFQFIQEPRKLNHLVVLQFEETHDALLYLTVVREGVVTLVDPEWAALEVTADSEGGDAGRIGLEGEGD